MDDVAPSMFMEKLLKFMKKDEMIKRLEVLGKNFNVRDAAELKREYEQKIQELETREKELNVIISSKIHEITALEERKATISDEVNSIIEAELKEKRADLDIQLNQALIEQRIIEHSKLKEELEAEKQKCLENMESSCKYTLRRKEIQELMDATEVLQEQKELVRQDILKEIDAVKKLFKKQQEEMEEKIRQLSVDMEKSYMDATNRLVLQGRKLQQEDAKKFLNICCELQSLIYYGISEEELGVPPKKIESYLSRFMRDLKSVGYESEMPEIGEAFDAYKHEDVEPRDGEVEDVDLEEAVVKEVVSCAFKTTEDGVEDYVKKAKVVVGRKV